MITLHSHEEPLEEDRSIFRVVPTFNILGLHEKYWGTADPVKAVHVSRLDRKGGVWHANNTGVFDSLTWPMAKALRAFMAPFRNPNRGFDATMDYSNVLLFIPIVVVTSRLFAVDGTSSSPHADQVDHIRFQREFKAKNLAGDFPLDFVERTAFPLFIDRVVNAFGIQMVEAVEGNLDAIIPHHQWPMRTDW